ncbi:hypothetical protein [Glycomyces tritici]|uniref:Uncharacterized protein n=1 Tax=Glycomyces tritici TaxID=2665176 RepID=A0ABT7YRL7_9ACTN|nr:hypothetical protein [Glycomyces tritici]MDN3241265.1 hypothetical protein [Glycomyces tritici]MDN3243288.1 hypothetical protein [Glycomyces tritici]
MSAFDDYLAQLRRLDETRRSAAEAAARTASAAESLGQRTARLADQAAAQRTAVDDLARAARIAPPQRVPNPPPLHGDPTADLDAAEADLRTAGAELEEARYLAHRAPLLPRWRADERNGLIYGLFALLCVVVQLLVLRNLRAEDTFGIVLLAAVLIGAPLGAFGLGWLTIGVAARPRIGDEEKRLERNYRLGLVVCASTLVVACLGFFS